MSHVVRRRKDKYDGTRQGWGTGTPSHSSQRKADKIWSKVDKGRRKINKQRRAAENKKAGQKGSKGCALIALVMTVGAPAGIITLVLAWRGML